MFNIALAALAALSADDGECGECDTAVHRAFLHHRHYAAMVRGGYFKDQLQRASVRHRKICYFCDVGWYIEKCKEHLDLYHQTVLPNGWLHSVDDSPAHVDLNGAPMKWYTEGRLDRGGDQPAVIGTDGERLWFKAGNPYRENDQPTEVEMDGVFRWKNEDDELHRDHDKPALISLDRVEFHRNGMLDREHDKPAFIGTDSQRRHFRARWCRKGRVIRSLVAMRGTQLYDSIAAEFDAYVAQLETDEVVAMTLETARAKQNVTRNL